MICTIINTKENAEGSQQQSKVDWIRQTNTLALLKKFPTN